jgi:hypothetical protein
VATPGRGLGARAPGRDATDRDSCVVLAPGDAGRGGARPQKAVCAVGGTAAAISSAMRFSRVRSALQLAVLAVLPTCNGDTAFEQELVVDPRAPGVSELVAACRASDSDCEPLCEAVLKRLGESVDNIEYLECYIRDLAPEATLVSVTYDYPVDQACGRRPVGYRAAAPRGGGVGAVLARMAELEAASVPAFLRLGAELAEHGAPAALIGAARRAAGDEVRHTAQVAALAAAFGGRARVAAAPPRPPRRPLVELAVDNAVEGGVREAVGAALADYQARTATVAAVRQVFRGVAHDEAGHAGLALAIDRWIAPRLSRERGAGRAGRGSSRGSSRWRRGRAVGHRPPRPASR